MIRKNGILDLRLTQFRSYESVRLQLSDSFEPVVLTGHNGAGKTNILEAISFLTPGRGLRSAKLSDVARRDESDLAQNIDVLPSRWSVSAQIQTLTDRITLGTGTIDGSDRRQVRIDGKNVSKQSELGQFFRCLWLTPAQDRLFCGDPVSRRRFLDRLVQAFDGQHANRLSDYNTAFKQWSCLLREGRFDTVWLEALEQQMVETGVAIAASRLDVVGRVSKYLSVSEDPLFPTAEIQLTGVVEQSLLSKPAIEVEDDFFDRLRRSRKSFSEGGSLTGPHTSDFMVIHKHCKK
jgi:DNA replication and repair protein RecF